MGDVWEKMLKDRGYKIQHTLGEGAYSKVKSAYSNRLKKNVAIKCIDSKLAPRDFVEKFLPRELETLPLLRHDNIVRVYEIMEASDGLVYIVMEIAHQGDMLRYVQRKGALPEPELKRYFWQLCQAVRYCHSQNICHRDLKCENLLLDKHYKLLLTDFGFSKPMLFDTKGHITLSQTFCGSAAYAAPEIIQGRPYDPRMHDMWSLGVILYIMSCGHMPFDDSNVRKMLKVQLKNQIRFPSRVNDILSINLKNLIRMLIQPDVTLRGTMDRVLAHAFFNGFQEQMNSGSRPHTSRPHVNEEEEGPSRSVNRRQTKPDSDPEQAEHRCCEDRSHRDCTCVNTPDPEDKISPSPSPKRSRQHRNRQSRSSKRENTES